MTAPNQTSGMPNYFPPPPLDIREFSLSGRLDGDQVEALQRRPEWRAGPAEFRVHLSRIQVVEPVGAALLARLCQLIERRGLGRVTLIGLPVAIQRRLRRHPLLRHHDAPEHLFGDPFEVPGASNR